MKPKKTWVLLADGARARVLVNGGPGKGLLPALNHDFAASHASNVARGTDRPGRGNGTAAGSRHAVESKVDWHQFEKDCFAKDVADILNKAAQAKTFDRLVLVAPPTTMGALRKALRSETKALVHEEVVKDLTHLKDHDLEAHLKEVMVL